MYARNERLKAWFFVSIVLACTKQRKPSVRLRLIMAAMAIGGAASYILGRTTEPLLSIGLVAVIGASLAAFTPVAWGLLQEIDTRKG